MKILLRTSVTAAAVVAAAVLAHGAPPGHAGHGSEPGRHGGGMPAHMARMVGPELIAACHAELGELGVPEASRSEIEEQRFEVQKAVIRAMAELQVAKLELAKMISRKDFDLTAAQKKIGEISAQESAIRSAHVELLHALASKLDAEQWRALREQKMTPGGRMEGMEMMHGGADSGRAPCMGCPDKPQHGGARHGHGHGRSSEEAEEFFREE